MQIHICTGSTNKVREFERILATPLTSSSIDLDEIQSIDIEKVCRRKAEAAFSALAHPVLVDDTGFELSALDGFPGPMVTWALKGGTSAILHRMLPPSADEAAKVVTAIGFAYEAGVHVFCGAVAGTVIAVPRGSNGFGFDDVFVPEGETRTLAEMSDAEKDAISPRGIALTMLATFLRELNHPWLSGG